MGRLMKSWLVIGLLLSATTYALAEDLTLTTYFPSPRGIYNSLIAAKIVVGKTTTPDDSAMLELAVDPLDSTTWKGFLMPRVSDPTQIKNAADGLLVYDTTKQAYMSFRAGTVNSWVPAGDSFWTSANGTDISNINPGNIGIGVARPTAKLQVVDGAVWFDGANGGTPTSGAGTRLMWIPAKQAFRAGQVSGAQWDDANVGVGSVAFGLDTTASGNYSMAVGQGATAIGATAFAFGHKTIAGVVGGSGLEFAFGDQTQSTGGAGSTAMGHMTIASGLTAIALGDASVASGQNSTAMGTRAQASGSYSVAIGKDVSATALDAMVLGSGFGVIAPLTNGTPDSLMVGFKSNLAALYVGPSVIPNVPGPVGIGTISPKQALEVNGGVRLNPAGTKPSCTNATSATDAGTLWYTKIAGGKDTLEVCASGKTPPFAYAWQLVY